MEENNDDYDDDDNDDDDKRHKIRVSNLKFFFPGVDI